MVRSVSDWINDLDLSSPDDFDSVLLSEPTKLDLTGEPKHTTVWLSKYQLEFIDYLQKKTRIKYIKIVSSLIKVGVVELGRIYRTYECDDLMVKLYEITKNFEGTTEVFGSVFSHEFKLGKRDVSVRGNVYMYDWVSGAISNLCSANIVSAGFTLSASHGSATVNSSFKLVSANSTPITRLLKYPTKPRAISSPVSDKVLLMASINLKSGGSLSNCL